MRRFIAAPLFGISIAACVAGPTRPPAAPQAAAPEPAPPEEAAQPEEPVYTTTAPREAAPQVPTTGGTSLESAEPVMRGATIEGWAAKDQPRFYRLDLAEAGELRISWYTRIMTSRGQGAGINPILFVLDENGGKISERMVATYATSGTGNFDEETISVPVANVGPVYLQVDCQNCGNEMVHFKIVIP